MKNNIGHKIVLTASFQIYPELHGGSKIYKEILGSGLPSWCTNYNHVKE